MPNACRRLSTSRRATRNRALISSPPSSRGYPSENRPSVRISESPRRTSAVGDVHVALLDDNLRRTGAPQRVRSARRSFPVNVPSTRGLRKAPVITPSNSPRPPNSTACADAAEVLDDADEHLIAFLPVAAHDVERQTRALAVRRRAAEGDVRLLGDEPAVFDRDLVRPVGVCELARNRQMRRQRRRRERTPSIRAGRTLGRRRGDSSAAGLSVDPMGTTPGGGVTTRRPPPRCSLKRPERPFEDVVAATRCRRT